MKLKPRVGLEEIGTDGLAQRRFGLFHLYSLQFMSLLGLASSEARVFSGCGLVR